MEAAVGVDTVVATDSVTAGEKRGKKKEWRCVVSAMVISSAEGFAGMAKPLEDYGITNIHFCSVREKTDLDVTAIAFVPFVDFIIVGRDAGGSPYLNTILREAKELQIPVLTESCIVAQK